MHVKRRPWEIRDKHFAHHIRHGDSLTWLPSGELGSPRTAMVALPPGSNSGSKGTGSPEGSTQSKM